MDSWMNGWVVECGTSKSIAALLCDIKVCGIGILGSWAREMNILDINVDVVMLDVYVEKSRLVLH